MDKKSQKILCTALGPGRKHDFRLFKESGLHFHRQTYLLTDTGYVGIKKIHANADHPKKSSKLHPLTKQDKQANRDLSSLRVLNENVLASLKRFKILSDRYRNRRRRFGLRFTLIAAIYNFELPP